MILNVKLILMQVLLQTGQPGDPAGPGGAPASGIGGFIRSPMFLLMMMFVVFYGVIIRGNRKEKKKKADMLSAVERNDRVLTIGGIIGTVVQVKDDELVVKIDESTNTKINILRSAVRQVLTGDDKPGDSAG